MSALLHRCNKHPGLLSPRALKCRAREGSELSL